MKNYLRLCPLLFLLITIKTSAQITLNTATKPGNSGMPYHVPQVEDAVKTIAAFQIRPKQPDPINIAPNFSVSPSAQQCALLNSIIPSLYLEGERSITSVVDLKWLAKDLYDKKGFEVQRSFGDTNNFKPFAYVQAYSNALAKEEYKLNDINKSIQPTYYRLKQLKSDSGYTYSNIVLVKGILQFHIFPNPVSDVLFLKLQTVQNSNISIMIYDNKGVLLLNKQTSLMKDIINTKNVNVQALPAGMYNIKVANADSTLYSEKFIKE